MLLKHQNVSTCQIRLVSSDPLDAARGLCRPKKWPPEPFRRSADPECGWSCGPGWLPRQIADRGPSAKIQSTLEDWAL